MGLAWLAPALTLACSPFESDAANNDAGRGAGGGGSDDPADACAEDVAPGDAADAINAHRATVDLPAVPLSASLMAVAQAHVDDLEAHYGDMDDACSMHSWSDAGDWTSCCYTDDHAQAECMWNKPAELTSFNVTGFEISYGRFGCGVTSVAAIDAWLGSDGHRSVIEETGTWSGANWGALGAAMSESFAVAWFAVDIEE